jgi:ketosteroid isomerase-like protein
MVHFVYLTDKYPATENLTRCSTEPIFPPPVFCRFTSGFPCTSTPDSMPVIPLNLTETQQQSLALAHAYFESIQRRDAAAVQALLADDVVETIPLNANGTPEPWAVFEGKEAVMGYVQQILHNFSHINFIDPEYTVSTDGAVVFFEAQGDLTGTQGSTAYHNVYVIKLTLRAGFIVKLTEYANPVTYAKLMGLPLG